MFGIPMVGGDICGTSGNSTSELCSRWTQVATLFPLSRFYFNATNGDSDPWAFNDVALNTINFSIRVKYALLQHMYTLLFKQFLSGGMVIKPTFFSYPSSSDIYKNFLIGDDLLVHPVFEEGIT